MLRGGADCGRTMKNWRNVSALSAPRPFRSLQTPEDQALRYEDKVVRDMAVRIRQLRAGIP
jgi:hypothetical protein